MQDHDDDNIFDEDDALDFIIYEELNKQSSEHKKGKGGCLEFAVLLLLPIVHMMFLC